MSIRVKVLLVFFIISVSDLVSAQERYLDIVQKYRRPQFFAEFAAFPVINPDSLCLYGNVRLSYDNSFFVKTKTGKFSTDLTFSIEILQRNTSVSRKIIHKTVVADSHEVTTDRDRFVEVLFKLPLKKGDYEATIEITNNDLQKSLRIERQQLKLNVPDKSSKDNSLKLSDVLLISRPTINDSTIQFKPLGVSGNGIFGNDYLALVELQTPARSSHKISYQLFEKKEEVESLVAEGLVEKLFFSSAIKLSEEEGLFIVKRLDESSNQIVLVDFKARTLPNTRYVLKVKAYTNNGEAEVKKEFDNAWVNMPYPLYDIELAVRLMEGIMISNDEASGILDGNNDQQRRKFLAYWKKQDPTPDTEFNEALAEYFSRVDHTFFNFYTNREFGWRTDRGKVYIQYGKPSEVSREFPVNRPTREIWFYNTLNKRFVFADITNSGNYELISEGKVLTEEKLR